MEPYLLLVTLVLGYEQPHTYQVEFKSKGSCEKASANLRKEYLRVSGRVIVSAICVEK